MIVVLECHAPSSVILAAPSPLQDPTLLRSLKAFLLSKLPSSPPMNQIASPDWLPHGWITELHIRQIGTTAGTRDKYYKDLLSGRRFRSRNEVLRFLQTGKGRVRKRHTRGKKLTCDVAAAVASSVASPDALAQSHDESPMLHSPTLANDDLSPRKPALAVAAASSGRALHSPRLVSDDDRSPCTPVHATTASSGGALHSRRLGSDDPMPSKQLVVPTAGGRCLAYYEDLSPSHRPGIPMASTTTRQPSIEIGSKRSVPQGSPQELPIKKKPRTLSSPPQDPVDKQACKLWQCLPSPALKSNDPQIPDGSERLDLSECEELPQMSSQEIRVVLERGLRAAQKTVELGKEIQATERTVALLSREMLATVERLGHEVREGRNAIESRNQAAFSDELRSEAEEEAAKRSSNALSSINQAAQMIDAAMVNVLQAVERIDATMGTIIQASQKLDVAIGNMIHAPQMHHCANNTNTEFIQHDGDALDTKPRPEITSNLVIEGAPQPIVALGNGYQETQQPDAVDANSYQAARTHGVSSICRAAKVSLLPILAMGQASQTALLPALNADTMITRTESKHVLPFTPDVHIPATICIDQIRNLTSNTSSGLLVEKKGMTEMNSGSPATPPRLSATENKQIVAGIEPRDKNLTSILNPKLDLTKICMNMTRRQRARMRQTLKARHTRGLLAAVGRRLCYVALERGTCVTAPNSRPYS